MSDDEPFADAPTSKTERVKYAIGNLWDDFGSTESIGLGLIVNLGLAALGIVVFVATSGLVSYAGAVWAILHILAIVKWVVGL